MQTFKYTARDPATGKKIVGEIQSSTEQAVAELVKAQGYAVLSVEFAKEGRFKFSRGKIKAKDKVLFSRQLATLINAGLPLVQSLRSVSGQTKNRQLKIIITEIIRKVEGGMKFSDALERYPDVFNRIFVSLVAAGEASGTLDKALTRVANQQEKDAELASKIRGAMVYPLIVLLVMFGVVGFMIIAVLPQVEELYNGLSGASLPLITRILLAVSGFVTSFWWIVVSMLAVFGFFGTKWARTTSGIRRVDSLKLYAWPVSALFQKVYMARFSRTSATLVSSGVPLIQVMEITASAVNNVLIEQSIKAAAVKVKGGKSLSESLEGDDKFLELVPQMIKIGEDSGAIEQMLDKTATYYEKEVDDQVKAISTIVEPFLMIVLGVVAIGIVSAILLPIYGLVGQGIGR